MARNGNLASPRMLRSCHSRYFVSIGTNYHMN
jgi:hypothetical protein